MINFRNGMAVVTSLGEQVGHVKNLVVTPDVGQVSHLIIGRGFLFTEDKVMPANWISHNDGDRLILNADQVKFDSLPNFIEREFTQAPTDSAMLPQRDAAVPTNRFTDSPSLLYLGAPGIDSAAGTIGALGGPIYISRETQNIPENSVVLGAGGRVISRDGQHVGNIAQTVASEGGTITHFVISQGLLFHTHKIVPVHWIDKVENNDAHLVVTASSLQTLPDYNQV